MKESSNNNDTPKYSPEDQAFIDCLTECQRKMLEKKARLGQEVVLGDENGKPVVERAIDVYHRVFGELPPLY